MSHFYSQIKGHRGEATRCGTKSSGIRANATGWDIGGTCKVHFNPQLGTDVVEFYLTDGSNGRSSTRVATFASIDGKLQLLNTSYPELFL